MDDLLATLQGSNPQQQGGSAPASQPSTAGFDPTKTYGTPAQLLDNLKQTESSGRPLAVNQKTGAMGPYQFTPSTLAMLRGQGIKFDPFDPQEARSAADWYIQHLKQQNGGTYEGALKAYGGFKNADPTQYIQKTMAGVPTVPGQSNSGDQPSGYSGPMSDLLDTLQTGMQSAQKAAQQPAPQPTQQAQPAQQPSALARFGQAAVGLGDTVLGAPLQALNGVATNVGYAALRPFMSPGRAMQIAGGGSDVQDANHPVSTIVNAVKSALGDNSDIRNTPGYQGEATQQLSNILGQKMGQGVSAVASATGLPQQDVANMAGTLAMAAPKVVGAVAPIARDAAVATAADDVNVRPESAPKQFGPAMQERPMVGGGAASATTNTYPILTGEENSRGPFPQVKTSKIAQDVTPEEQALRSRIVNQIMGDDAGQVRTGVITGNENTLRDEYAAAKSPNQTDATQALKQQIANEQTALSQFAQDRINATGASQTILNNEERGRIVNDAIYGPEDSLTSYLRDAKRQIYDAAQQQHGANPIETGHVDTLFADPQFQAGVRLSNNESTLSGAQDLINLARTTGFKDPVTGEMYAPNSVAAWNAVRKSLNSEWSQSNRNVIGKINGAIDQDIAASGGQEMYALGNRIHQVEKTLLDSKGIGSVLGEYDANGIKTGTSLDNIPAKLNSMPLDQWQHIRDTLDDLSRGQIRGAPEGMPPVPNEVMQAAAQARSEMDGALAREVYQAGASKAGVWNQNSVNAVLNSKVGEKITRNFSPDEVQAFHTLNYGGQIMPGVHAYEGAGNQLSRIGRPGYVEKFAPTSGASVGAAIGSAIPVPGAGFVGAAIGERVGNKLSAAAASRRAQQQYQNVLQEMIDNSELGRKSLH